ncbi:hypothetical protein [Bacillus sp. FJAT-27445]|uniref:hypothetical protein n=1 Tax=Bacillus sp. FJAT-27445 TaxID=1679166 RepID=UPI0007436108|nr:hypothetical protein [Bacillus sp. FJAT-27445]
MPSVTTKKFDFVFSSSVTPTPSKEEFIIEFYPYTPDWSYMGKPIKITKNFEELIGFFEEMDETER